MSRNSLSHRIPISIPIKMNMMKQRAAGPSQEGLILDREPQPLLSSYFTSPHHHHRHHHHRHHHHHRYNLAQLTVLSAQPPETQCFPWQLPTEWAYTFAGHYRKASADFRTFSITMSIPCFRPNIFSEVPTTVLSGPGRLPSPLM